MKNLYKYTDATISYLTKLFIKRFENIQGNLFGVDEINIIGYVDDLYADLQKVTLEKFLELAKKTFGKYSDGKNPITAKWVKKKLSDYDPITAYVYFTEFDRKCARFGESLIATECDADTIKRGLKDLTRMTNQYAITITDEALKEAYESNGVEQVKWRSQCDSKVCSECSALNGKVFKIADIPPKPHWNCRCVVIPYKEDSNA